MSENAQWWKKAVFYQIYPRSFADDSGDGIGDFPGMTSKLDILKDLGIDAIWLSPHYPSPFVDCGYDISDYEDAAPEYGGMMEFKRFLDEAHRRGIRLMLDLVLNHTSDQHRWFIESKSSLDNPKRDWYIWRKGKGGNPPTNWYSTFGGSAWDYDPATDEYYYHFFYKEQPDLNWSNPEVKKAMFDMVRFWLDMGVDGFRLDAIGTVFEDETYPDQPVQTSLEEMYRREQEAIDPEEKAAVYEEYELMFQYQHDQPGVHELMKELRQVVNEYHDRVMVGETDDIAFYGNGDDELQLNFNFPLMRTKKITPKHVIENQRERLSKLPRGAWPCNTLGNHDCPRMLSEFGDGVHDEAIARVNLMLLLTLKGTPFLYNGEEFGMSNVKITSLDDFVDPVGRYYYQLEKEVMGVDETTALCKAAERSRDKGRNPLQWSRESNGGFCPEGVKPWLPMNPNYANGVNYADEARLDDSMWNYYRRVLAFRKASPSLSMGEQRVLESTHDDLLIYMRETAGESSMILLNMGEAKLEIELASYHFAERFTIIATDPDRCVIDGGKVRLKGYCGVILRQES